MVAGERLELLLYGYTHSAPSSFLYARRDFMKRGVLGRFMNCAPLPSLRTPHYALRIDLKKAENTGRHSPCVFYIAIHPGPARLPFSLESRGH